MNAEGINPVTLEVSEDTGLTAAPARLEPAGALTAGSGGGYLRPARIFSASSLISDRSRTISLQPYQKA